MAHKFDPAHIDRLDAPERRALLAPAETLTALGFSAGQTLADIGCGTGIFSLEAARTAGKVYAVDLSTQMLEVVRQRAADAGFSNLMTARADEYDFKLPDTCADFVLICTVLHEIDDKVRWLKEAARVCNRGGFVAVIEFEPDFEDMGPPASIRLAKEQTKVLLKNAGLLPVGQFSLQNAFYVVKAART
ncbi:MAG: methyltransferase domain-containing protein [Ethanoligenens sp.]